MKLQCILTKKPIDEQLLQELENFFTVDLMDTAYILKVVNSYNVLTKYKVYYLRRIKTVIFEENGETVLRINFTEEKKK